MVWPEGMLPLPRNTDPELLNQVSEKFPWGGMATGRRRRKLSFKTVVKISESATASPASRAVPLIFESFPINPAAYSETGAAIMPYPVALPEKTWLKPSKAEARRK